MAVECLADIVRRVSRAKTRRRDHRTVERYQSGLTMIRLREALAREEMLRHERDELAVRLGVWQATAAKHIEGLTPRERQIMELVLDGHPSKNIAADLGISQRTVENHRASIMRKTGSKSLSALVQTALVAAWSDAPDAGAQTERSHR